MRQNKIDDVKDTFGLSDWELTDIYNFRYGDFRSSPLPEKLAEPAYNAVLAQKRENQIEEDLRREALRKRF